VLNTESQVEGQPFDISKDELLESPYFKIILSSTPRTNKAKSPYKCKNTIKPIILENVRAIEMDALCRVLYGYEIWSLPSSSSQNFLRKGKLVKGCEEWMRVLGLAHKWGFEDVSAPCPS
jgi:hypothetical protein